MGGRAREVNKTGMSDFPESHLVLNKRGVIEKMRNQLHIICLLLIKVICSAEERLSWFTKDPKIKKSVFVPDNLPEGKEENRILPWVLHDDEDYKIQLNCIMRGYNASNNPSDYKDARWSHPGFIESQVDTSAPHVSGNDGAVPYRIWTIVITTSTADAGKKLVTCEFQQGDFPLSTDFKFLIFRKVSMPPGNVMAYDLGELLEEEYATKKDLTKKVEEDIKRQISEPYFMSASDVTRSGNKFILIVPNEDLTIPPSPTPIIPPNTPSRPNPTIPSTPTISPKPPANSNSSNK